MKRTLFILLLLFSGTGTASAQYALQFGAAVTATGDQVLIGEGRNLLLPGSVYVYQQASDGTWQNAGVLTPHEADEEALGFGRALSAHGNTLAIGAPLAGNTYLYVRDDAGAWNHTATLTSESPGFGAAVAVYGDLLVVGAPGAGDAPGSAYAYQQSVEGAWTLTGTLTAEDIVPRDGFGSTVSVMGNHAVVGSPMRDNRTGAVHVFQHDAETAEWKLTYSLVSTDAGDRFGTAALFYGDFLAVSAPGADAGKVSLFTQDAETNTWVFNRNLLPFDADKSENFGVSLAFAGEELWVGAPGHASREGAVYRFQWDEATAQMTATWRTAPDDLQYRSGFGTAVAAGDGVIVVGANGHDNFEGAAFPYMQSDGEWNAAPPVRNEAGEIESVVGGMVACEEGEAGRFPCAEVDMVAFLTRHEIGAKRGIQVNDVWGWEDSETGHEYALVGRTDGTSFIDLTDPSMPIYIGDLPKTATANQSLWRDIKVYRDHAFIVADGAGAHHVQIFDLRQLRDVEHPPVQFTETALYKGIYSSHNIIINEETGYAYAVGNDSGGETCGGALHMINIQDPVNPTFAGCFADTRTGRSGTGTTHDAQCVSYVGPDTQYQGREICLSSNGTALSIADVTDKDNPVAISLAEYPNVSYTHQGWLTEDHRYFYLNDEGDEMAGVVDATRTLIFDVSDLDDPAMVGEYMGPSSAIDHNLYIRGNTMYQTNYVEGLRLVDITDPENPTEVGHFDTVPYGKNDNSPVLGAWSNYPFFKSGVIVVTSGREGVFFLKKKAVDI